MSDSSSEEDLSRFKDVVDTSFTKALTESKLGRDEKCRKQKSDRYLDEATHYNDVKVPEEMQKRIGAKLSAIINKKYEFAEVKGNNTETHPSEEVSFGVKLFKDSSEFLSCQEEKDVSTEIHNKESRKNKKRKKKTDGEELKEHEKIDAAVVSGEHILAKEEIKHWKSRRKEKVFKYKSKKGNKVLIAVE